MNELNAVLQEGLLKVAKERPENPIKELGLFLINYKKDWSAYEEVVIRGQGSLCIKR